MITPTLEQLGGLHNFTTESQVQLYAPLAFEPPKRKGGKGDYHILGEDERKIFINSAEWTLCSYTVSAFLPPICLLFPLIFILAQLHESPTIQSFTLLYSYPLRIINLFSLMMTTWINRYHRPPLLFHNGEESSCSIQVTKTRSAP